MPGETGPHERRSAGRGWREWFEGGGMDMVWLAVYVAALALLIAFFAGF